MALWDVLSGKEGHFNKTRDEAFAYVHTILKSFVSSRLPDDPDAERILLYCRNCLYAFYIGADSTLPSLIKDNRLLAKFKQNIYSLSESNYLRLVCALHMTHVVQMHLVDLDSPYEAHWFQLQTGGICEMYRKHPDYSTEWVNRIDWFLEAPDRAAQVARLQRKMREEIAPLLGVDLTIESLLWTQARIECVQCMKGILETPNWNEVVERDFAGR